jgi:hypothetical protein
VDHLALIILMVDLLPMSERVGSSCDLIVHVGGIGVQGVVFAGVRIGGLWEPSLNCELEGLNLVEALFKELSGS